MSYVKIYKYKKQISLDNGVTWQDVTPAEYVPSGDPIGYYDTYNECMAQYRTIQSGTTCTGTHGVDKHNLDVYEVSYDNGVTWEVVSTSAGTLIEANSPDCGYSARTVSTGTTCVGVDKYQLIENQESYDYGVTWITISSSTGSLIETNSYDCGYRTRQTSGTPYCTGYDKYVDVSNQVSTDYGNTWTTISTAATMVEHNSEDCGYVPPFDGKYKLTFNDSTVTTKPCDSTSAITYDEIDAYGNRTGITSVQLGECVTKLYNGAFENCTSLSSIIIPDSVTIIDQYSFHSCSSLTNVTLGSGVTTIGDEAFDYCTSLASINIPNSVTSIGSAFGDCISLSSITIPSSVNNIGSFAFAGCYNLSNVVIENGVNYIGTAMFQGCTSISSFTIPDSVATINAQAFGGCTNLTDLSIGSGVTSIGNYAFSGCTALENITISATTPPTLSNYSPFRNTNNSFIIYVPCESVNTYKTASGWSNYASRIQCIPKFKLLLDNSSIVTAACDSTSAVTQGEISSYVVTVKNAVINNCVTEIGDSAFSGCTSLTSITIPSTVTTISGRGLRECTSLTSITIPDSVTSIGNYAFYGCSGFTSLTIPESVTNIGNGAFTYCSGLTSINIPSGITNIGSNTFSRCFNLINITIPSGVTNIGQSGFRYCRSLTSITCLAATPPTLQFTGGNQMLVFDDTNDCPIYVPSGSVNTYKSASGWSTYASRIQAIP